MPGTQRTPNGSSYISLRFYREHSGSILLCVWFNKMAVRDLDITSGDRMEIGIQSGAQRMAFRPVLYGGNAVQLLRDDSVASLKVRMPLDRLPRAQHISRDDLQVHSDFVSFPFMHSTESLDISEWRSNKARKLLPIES